MAQQAGVRLDTRRHCLEDFAKTLGEFPPRQPIPPWWAAFDEWFQESHEGAKQHAEEEGKDLEEVILLVRMEAFGYADDSE